MGIFILFIRLNFRPGLIISLVNIFFVWAKSFFLGFPYWSWLNIFFRLFIFSFSWADYFLLFSGPNSFSLSSDFFFFFFKFAWAESCVMSNVLRCGLKFFGSDRCRPVLIYFFLGSKSFISLAISLLWMENYFFSPRLSLFFGFSFCP